MLKPIELFRSFWFFIFTLECFLVAGTLENILALISFVTKKIANFDAVNFAPIKKFR
jgi:hypothetical protein